MSEHDAHSRLVAAIGPRAALFDSDGDRITDWLDVEPDSGAALVVPEGADNVRYGLSGAATDHPDYLSGILPTVSAGEVVRVRLP